MKPMHRAAAIAVVAGAALTLATPASAQLALPDVLPLDPAMAGPDLLRAPSPRAPQLENTGIWRAAPIMVCHASAYRAGEFIHQGCVYDDQGAQLVPTNWPDHSITFAYRYPTAEAYRQNAADLVEVRVKPLSDTTAIRITYNTMLDPSLVAATSPWAPARSRGPRPTVPTPRCQPSAS